METRTSLMGDLRVSTSPSPFHSGALPRLAFQNIFVARSRLIRKITALDATAEISQLLGGRRPSQRPDPPQSGSRDARPAAASH